MHVTVEDVPQVRVRNKGILIRIREEGGEGRRQERGETLDQPGKHPLGTWQRSGEECEIDLDGEVQ